MATIVTRAGKGIPLTNADADNNFTNLNTDKLEAGDALGTPASVTLTNATGLPTAGLVDNAVDNTKLRDSAGLSVIGRGANSTGDPADIVAGTNKQVLRRDGSSLAFGAVDLASNQAVTGTLPVNQGGTGITSFGTGVATWLGTPSSANLAAAVTDETGTGALVFATNATLVNPALGTPASGVVTNLTGTASININGTVGATTANTGAFTTLSASSPATFQAGTAALPAITTSGDTNTGLFFPAADTIAASTAGSERLRITDTGNVGIGTTAPSNKLGITVADDTEATSSSTPKGIDIYNSSTVAGAAVGIHFVQSSSGTTQCVIEAQRQNSSTAALVFKTEGSNAVAEKMRITGAGNVGIGTTAPSERLTVSGNINFSDINSKIYLINDSFRVVGIENEHSSPNSDLNIFARGLGGGWAGNIKFYTSNNSATLAERLRITSAGNLGIGTTSPDANLTVNGAASFAAGTDSLPSIARSGDLNTGIFFPAADTIAFAEGGAEAMRINSSGEVGIGTTTPGARLGVSGTIKSSGAVFADGDDIFIASGATVTIKTLASAFNNTEVYMLSAINRGGNNAWRLSAIIFGGDRASSGTFKVTTLGNSLLSATFSGSDLQLTNTGANETMRWRLIRLI